MSLARLIFVDETGAATNMARRYGRSARGLRLDGPVPHGHVWTPPPAQEESPDRMLRVIGCCHVSGL